MTIWQVQLEGDVRDLGFLANIFATGPRKVLRDERGPGYLYESDSFHPCSTSEQVEQLAKGELAILSGILKLERDAREGLKYGGVYRRSPNGGRDIFVRIHEPLQVRVESPATSPIRSANAACRRGRSDREGVASSERCRRNDLGWALSDSRGHRR